MEEPESYCCYVEGFKFESYNIDDTSEIYLHRLNGPAIIWDNDDKEWWIFNKQLNANEVEKWIDENNVDLTTEAGQMAFKMRWS